MFLKFVFIGGRKMRDRRVQPALDRAQRDREYLGNLLVWKPLIVAQHEHFAEMIRHPGDDAPDKPPAFVRFQLLAR